MQTLNLCYLAYDIDYVFAQEWFASSNLDIRYAQRNSHFDEAFNFVRGHFSGVGASELAFAVAVGALQVAALG